MSDQNLLNLAPEDYDISGRPTLNPIYIDATGNYHRASDGAILNIGGVVATNFTVNGKGILFADGSSSEGPGSSLLDLQNTYNLSENVNGFAQIKLAPQKGFALVSSDSVPVKFFTVSADGEIRLKNNTVIEGLTTKFVSQYLEADHWNIKSSNGSKTSLFIEPAPDVTFTTDVVRIKSRASGPTDLSINHEGDTYIRSLTFETIEGPAISSIYMQLTDIRNTLDTLEIPSSEEIEQLQNNLDLLGAQIVEINNTAAELNEVIDEIESAISELNATGIKGFKYSQNVPSMNWVIQHNGDANAVQYSVFDENGVSILCDEAKRIDNNTFSISFTAPQRGHAVLMCMTAPTNLPLAP
jgi:hypothetical protein